ncbi:MAG: chitobiase/beta-hexosaminidase C-terminal domain-containing protein [Fibrobacterota bacterium]|nr:chitobiase/beta-hexosaminidase C-terminal domain-containing protein [Fibrobacterota bacterium]
MKNFLIHIVALFTLGGYSSAQALIDVIDAKNPSPPTSNRNPVEVSPFVDTLHVRLSAESSSFTIYYDMNNNEPFTIAGAIEYAAGSAIVLSSTTVLRAVSSNKKSDTSTVAQWNYIKNAAPIVAFTSPSNGLVVTPGTSVTLKSSITDPTGPTPHSVHYYRAQAGGAVWIDLGPGNASYEYVWNVPADFPAGTQTLRVIAKDGLGLEDTMAISVTVEALNKAPTVTLDTPLNNQTYIGPATISLQATPVDADGSITKVEFLQNGTLIPPAKIVAPWTHDWTGVAAGNYVLTAVAYDNAGARTVSNSVNVTVTVVANKLPTVKLTYPINGNTYYAPFTGPITADALDSDGSIKNVDFYSGESLQFYDDLSPYSYSKSYPAGTYEFFAKAYDDKGGWTQSEKVTFRVAANLAPTARAGADTIVTLPTNSVALKGGTSTDPEGTTLIYEWSGPGVTFAGANSATPTAQLSGTGNWLITLKVTDQGTPPLSSTDQMTVTVTSKPSITSAIAKSGTAGLSFNYTLTAIGFPAPILSAPIRPPWLNYDALTSTLSGTPAAPGNFPVTITAKNDYGTDTKTLDISITNSLAKPIITNDLVRTTKVGTPFNFTLEASGNPAPDFTTGTLPAGLTHSGTLISGSPTVSGTYTIGITATNSQGNDTKSLALTINADPKITADLDSVKTVREKNSAVFTIAGSGFPNPTFQWQYSTTAAGPFTNVGNQGTIYTIESTSLSSAGYYRVIVKNPVGEVYSRVCRLAIYPIPAPIKMVANSGPLLKNAIVGERVVFGTKATGDPVLHYEWFKDNVSVKAPLAIDEFVIASAQTTDAGVYRARVTNYLTDLSKPETYAWSDTARLSVQLPKLAKPFAKPLGGPFIDPIKIVLATNEAGTAIHFTLQGEDPTQGGTRFNAGDTIRMKDNTFTLKARAYKSGFLASDVMSETYTYTPLNKVVKPVIKPPSPTFQGSMKCSLTTATPGASIFYTLDGTSPLLSSAKPYNNVPITLDATTTLIAVAKKSGMTDSDTLKMTYTLEKIQSKVMAPILTPLSRNFPGQLQITMLSPTDSAEHWYTTDGSSPDSSATKVKYVQGVPVTLTRTTTVRVIGTLRGFLNSDIVTEVYKLIPGPITANPRSDTIFESPITVKLSALPAGAVIRYVKDGTVPNAASPEFPIDGLRIDTTATLSAIAILDGVSSQVYPFSFTKKGGQLATPTPTTPGNMSTFEDTVRISFYSTRGAEIYYTLNGDPPKSGTKYSVPFVIDSTSTLQAVAIMTGFENSKVLSATYTLVPGRPEFSPPGGSSPTALHVKLSSSSKRASLYYTRDGSDPVPDNRILLKSGDSIPIGVTTTLKAVAVAGNMAGPVREELYTIFGVRNFSIIPGQTSTLEGGYTLRSPEDQTVPVNGQISGAGPLKLDGFDGVQYALTLALADGEANTGSEFPKLIFTRPSSDKRSMYRVDPSKKVYFISSADTVTLSQAGIYFMGIDVKPPVISHIGESFPSNDSTRVTFHIEDNVANLTYDLKRNDDPKKNETQRPVFSGQDLSAQLLHPPGLIKPLYVQLIVSDYQSASSYPSDRGTMLALSQRMGDLNGPPVWGVGESSQFPYDLVSIPLALDPPVTLNELRAANPGLILQGVSWNDKDTVYKQMEGKQTLMAGNGYWLGSRGRISSFSRPAAVTLPTVTGTFSVQLRHGWNQIGNPHLEEMYWPYSRNQGELYKGFPIKGLWEYSPAINDYVESESLKPWRGYFVYNYLQETSVTLSPRPITEWGVKKEAAAGQVNLALGWGSTRTVRLGADWTSAEGLGLEDEFALPRQNSGLTMQALRQGRALASDWIRLEQEGILQWKVAMGLTSPSQTGKAITTQSGTGDTLPPLRILSQNLPSDYETWAVSPSRGMKYRVESGKEIPASGLPQDTLLIYSGPKHKMAAFSILQKMALVAPSLDLRVSARNGGFGMQMALPSKAKIRAIVWGLDGTRKGELILGPLSEGLYRFAYDLDFRNRPGRLSPGMYFLSLEVQGPGINTRLSRKIVLSN